MTGTSRTAPLPGTSITMGPNPMFLRCNGIVLHARRLGDPGKPLVVFSNALGTDSRIWDGVVPRLIDRYGVLLYDTRGHGLSQAPRGPYAVADHAADLLGLLDGVGAPQVALVGLSVGGLVAQAVAADHPERVAALVLCDTAATIGDPATWDARAEAADYKGLEALADSTMERWFTRAYRAEQPVAVTGWRTMLARQPAGGYAATCATLRDADLRAKAATIRAPTLCLVGDGDASVPPDHARATADLIPGATFAIIPDAGHLSPVEQPGAVATHIVDHLAQAGYR